MEQPGRNLGLGRPGEDKCVQSLEAGGHVLDTSRPLSWLGEPEPSNLAIRIKVRRQDRLLAEHHISHLEYLLLSAISLPALACAAGRSVGLAVPLSAFLSNEKAPQAPFLSFLLFSDTAGN